MFYSDFLEQAINEGVAAAQKDYADPDSKQKLDGSIAGFEACRGKSPMELGELLGAAKTATEDAFLNEREDYWWYRCYELEVEWTCNVVSAALHNQGIPVIIPPTCRGAMKAASIVGVKNEDKRPAG